MSLTESTVTPTEPVLSPDEPSTKPRRSKRIGLSADQPMPEAGRAIMAFHFNRLRDYAGSAAEGDEDAVHDMRVATRRLRAALRIAGSYYKNKTVRSMRALLKELAADLGAVRDMDVLIAHGEKFDQPRPDDAPRLDAWLDYLKTRRSDGLHNLVEYLNGKRFAKLMQTFETFVAEPGVSVKAAEHPAGLPRVRDVVAAAVWQQYSIVRQYEAAKSLSLPALHTLRIETKRLRYVLEFFREVLGARAASLIELAVNLQDHLGELHDVDVASSLLREFLALRIQQGEIGTSPELAAVFDYQTAIQAEIAERVRQFPELWHPLIDPSFRRVLTQLLSRI